MGSQINLKLSAEYKGRSWSILGLYHPVRACLYCHMASQFDSSDCFPCPLTEILVFFKNRICSSETDGLRNTFKRFDGDRNNRFDKTCSIISCKIMGEKGCRGIEKHVAEEQHWCFPSILHSPASNSTCSHFTSSRHREGIQYHTGSLESWKNSQIKFILKRKSFFYSSVPWIVLTVFYWQKQKSWTVKRPADFTVGDYIWSWMALTFRAIHWFEELIL